MFILKMHNKLENGLGMQKRTREGSYSIWTPALVQIKPYLLKSLQNISTTSLFINKKNPQTCRLLFCTVPQHHPPPLPPLPDISCSPLV